MSLLDERARIQIVFASGGLRAGLQPSRNWLLLLVEAAIIFLIAVWTLRGWPTISLIDRGFALLILLGATTGWFEQLAGSPEIIEFDSKQLRIRRKKFGWEYIEDYPIQKCSDLEPRKYGEHHRGLQCKLGWRTIEFGDYLSEEQANEVLAALADSRPDLVPTLFPSVDITKHFTKLSLD
jgi:hypothetical protein